MSCAVAPATDSRRRAIARQALGEVGRITLLPDVTLRIIELVQDPGFRLEDLHRLVATDPALALRILKVANSAFYQRPGEIASLDRAIVLLGGEAIKGIAMATSLGRLLVGTSEIQSATARGLWLHLVAVGLGARMIAQEAGLTLMDEAFLGGLLHDIGFVVELRSNRHALLDVARGVAAGAGDFLDLEDRAFGANHQDFGGALCRHWNLPQYICDVIQYHHQPLELDHASRQIGCAIHIANGLAVQQKLGFMVGETAAMPDPAALELLGFDGERLDRIRNGLPEATLEFCRILG